MLLDEPFTIPATARDRFRMTLGPNRKWDDSTELLAEIVQSELQETRVQTNLNINARLNVPDGKGALLVQLPDGHATNGWIVVIRPLR